MWCHVTSGLSSSESTFSHCYITAGSEANDDQSKERTGNQTSTQGYYQLKNKRDTIKYIKMTL